MQGPRFAVEIDGVPLPPLVVHAGDGGGRTTVLASGLARQGRVHRLRMTLLTEPVVGEVHLLDLVTDGHLLPPPLPATRRLWFLGDSITCGYGNLGLGPHCPFSPATEDATLAFGAIAARRLGADWTAWAWSGRGLWQNLDDSLTGTVPELLADSLGKAPSVFAPEAAPHAIVVNLGTNDASALRPLDDEAFFNRLEALLNRLRQLAPEALIVLADGPMLDDGQPSHPRALSRVRAALQAATQARRLAGDARVVRLSFPTQTGRLGFGCDYHPSVATHAQMGQQLADALAHHLGWTQDRQFARAP